MPGRLGVDFGTSNTVITLWNDSVLATRSLQLRDFTHVQKTSTGNVFVVPSLIHYGENNECLFGNQVLQQNLQHSPRTFMWMKRYINRRDPFERVIDNKRINHFDAGQRFLSEVLMAAAEHVAEGDEEIAITVPVETFEDYSNWLAKVVHKSSHFRFRVIDEPSAAAIGYGVELGTEDVYLVFDFGGGTLDIAVVSIEGDEFESGRYCHVLGKAGIDVGGTTIDEWLYLDALHQNSRSESDPEIKAISRIILKECERAKESLSFNEKSDLQVLNPLTGQMISAEFTRSKFEDILDERDTFAQIEKTVRRALKEAETRGCSEDKIKSVLMVGGSSQISSVQKAMRRMFGNDRVMVRSPLDAVARGASVFVAGMAFKDYIQHDYAIRYVNPKTGSYEYRSVVRRGTKYPTVKPVASLTIKPSYDGQTELGVPIFEISGSAGVSGEKRVEMYFDSDGVPRLQTVTEAQFSRRHFFWINENNPTFLFTDPPGVKGEPRFRIEFSIDENRR
jgi:molecular chaperone DnaK